MSTKLTRDDLTRAFKVDAELRRRLEFVCETKGIRWTGVDLTLYDDHVAVAWEEYHCGDTDHCSEIVSFDDILAPDDALISAREVRLEAERAAAAERNRVAQMQRDAAQRARDRREYERLKALFGAGAEGA